MPSLLVPAPQQSWKRGLLRSHAGSCKLICCGAAGQLQICQRDFRVGSSDHKLFVSRAPRPLTVGNPEGSGDYPISGRSTSAENGDSGWWSFTRHTSALSLPPPWNLCLPTVSTPAWEPQAAGFSGESQVLMLVTGAPLGNCGHFVCKPRVQLILGG